MSATTTRVAASNRRSAVSGRRTEHWGKKICVLLISHNGQATDAEKAVNAVRAALPKPIIDFAGPIPYTTLQSMFDGLYPNFMMDDEGEARIKETYGDNYERLSKLPALTLSVTLMRAREG